MEEREEGYLLDRNGTVSLQVTKFWQWERHERRPHSGETSNQSSALLRLQSEITTTHEAAEFLAALMLTLNTAICALWCSFWVVGFGVVVEFWFFGYCLECCTVSLIVSFLIYAPVHDHLALCDMV